MPYIFSKRFTTTQRYDTEALISGAIKSNWSFNRFQREAMKVSLSYKRMDMQYDFRRAQSSEKALTVQGKERAVKYFEKLYEPHRKKMGWTSTQETEWRRKGKMGLLEKEEDQEAFEEEWKKYEELRKAMGLK